MIGHLIAIATIDFAGSWTGIESQRNVIDGDIGGESSPNLTYDNMQMR